MKKLEKALCGTYLIFFLLQTIDYTGVKGFFWLATVAVSVYYAIGAYWRLKPKKPTQSIFVIVGGVVFGVTTYSLFYNIKLSRNPLYDKYLPIPIIIFFVALAIYLLINRKQKLIVTYYKPILLRSFALLMLSSLFAFGTPENSYYRSLIIVLNAGSPALQANMQMFGYVVKAKESLAEANCDKAIIMSSKAIEKGKQWLGIEGHGYRPDLEKDEIWKIHGTFTITYRAYACKADKAFENEEYIEALKFYLIADSILNVIPEENILYWKKRRAESKNVIGVTYYRLNILDSAAMYYLKAIKYYQKHINVEDDKFANYLVNLGDCAIKEGYDKQAISLISKGINILKSDSSNYEEVSELHFSLVKLGLLNSKFKWADSTLEQSNKYLSAKQKCDFELYQGISFYKQQQYKAAIQAIGRSVDCFKSKYGEKHQNVGQANLMLFVLHKLKANYKTAIKHLELSKEIISLKYPEESYNYLSLLQREASYLALIGDFDKSKAIYEKLLIRYSDDIDEHILTLTVILTELADLNIQYGLTEEAENQIDRAIQISESAINLEESESLLNTMAYVTYALGRFDYADSLYTKVIKVTDSKRIQNNQYKATALNGLGLIQYHKGKFKEADSLYDRSLGLYNNIFPEGHPDLAVVKLNKASLMLSLNKIEQAEQLVNNGLKTFMSFHDNTHPIFADFYLLKGNIFTKKHDVVNAIKSFKKALEILTGTFGPGHPKVKMVNHMLRSLRHE